MFWLMLDGGPCAGAYRTQRAPANLKAVRVPPKGNPDVLDLPDDRARDHEEVFLYERTSAQSEGIVCMRRGGCGHIVLYRFVRPLRGQSVLFDSDARGERRPAGLAYPSGTVATVSDLLVAAGARVTHTHSIAGDIAAASDRGYPRGPRALVSERVERAGSHRDRLFAWAGAGRVIHQDDWYVRGADGGAPIEPPELDALGYGFDHTMRDDGTVEYRLAFVPERPTATRSM